jgi:mycofactocin biosynthesis protein MftB
LLTVNQPVPTANPGSSSACAVTPAAGPSVAPDAAYALHPSVAVRPEPFGALVYHYGNRKLVFLKSPQLVAVVEHLHQYSSVIAALNAVGVPASSHRRYCEALSSLLASDMIVAAAQTTSQTALDTTTETTKDN